MRSPHPRGGAEGRCELFCTLLPCPYHACAAMLTLLLALYEVLSKRGGAREQLVNRDGADKGGEYLCGSRDAC